MLLDIQKLKNGQFAKRICWVPFFLGIEDKEFVGYGLDKSADVATSTKEVWTPIAEDLLAEDWEYFLDPYGYSKAKEPLPPIILATSSYIVPPNPPVTITPFKPYTNPLF